MQVKFEKMDERNNTRRSNCPVACTLDLIGDKWTLLVVRDLALGKKYFDEFLRSPEGIATNILTARLEWLQQRGFVEKQRDARDKRRSCYQLTQRGEELKKLVRLIARWGLKHLPDTEVFPPAEK
jgi:DNA-binding HxlR family transcriptional regulator